MTKLEEIARALEDADIGYSLRLTRLVDGVSEYTLTYDDGQMHIFEDIQDGYEHIRVRRREAQARAVLSTLKTPTPGVVEAGQAACEWVKGDEAADIYRAMIDAAEVG